MGVVGILILLLILGFSYLGFKKLDIFSKYAFEIDAIKLYKQYYRFVSSGFLHVSWSHLLFNVLALYFFSGQLEVKIGALNFIIVYFGSMIAGNALLYYFKKNDSGYSSVGASGAINGIIFASVVLNPNMRLGLIFLPIFIPGWLFGLLYLLFTIYGIKSKYGNSAHEAHLGGAMFGIIILLILYPSVIIQNYWVVLLLLIPVAVFLYLVRTRPYLLLIDGWKKRQVKDNIDHQYNYKKMSRQAELDELLDKIGKKGLKSLSKSEKERLDELSR